MPIKYIGRKTDFKGKTLWEILGNLKNFGVGRIVSRSMFERYEEPSYYKIVKVETLPNPKEPSPDNVRKVKVFVEKTFRGVTYPKVLNIEAASYKADYKLIPKDQEEAYCKYDGPKKEPKILPASISFPPLMREILKREMIAIGQPVEDDPQMPLKLANKLQSNYRVAKDGEKPTVNFEYGIGTPPPEHKILYKGI